MNIVVWIGMSLVLGEPLPPCSGTVIRAFEEGRHVDAARSAETCWTMSDDMRVLLFAAQAREGAGHISHAVRLYEQYLARALENAPERAGAEARLRDLMTRVVTIAVEAPAGELTLLLGKRPDVLRIAWPGGEGVVHLESGTWRLLVRDGTVQTFEVPGTERLEVMKARPRAVVPLVVSVRPAMAVARGARLELRAAREFR